MENIPATLIFLTDSNNVFVGIATIPTSDVTSDLITTTPPALSGGYVAVWKDNKWETALSKEGSDKLWAEVRTKRDELIAATDWTQLSDVTLNETTLAAVNAYREELRNIPQAFSKPDAVVWPVSPFAKPAPTVPPASDLPRQPVALA
jgi:Phage tail assembly chaperone protein